MAEIIKITRQKPILIAPAIPTEQKIKVLSPIDDQKGLRFHAHMIMSFKGRGSNERKDPAKVIKEALAKALVYYYPLAGRLYQGHNGELIVECNDKGALFIEADSNVTLEEIEPQILPPCPLLEDVLYDVPGSNGIINCPLLLFQVTRLLCGGYILGVRFFHSMCDSLGCVQLLITIAEIARGAQKPCVMPIWKRELLAPRYPQKVTCAHHEYQKVDDKSDQQQFEDARNMVHGCFYFNSDKLQKLRNLLPAQLQRNCTTFELLCAFMWICRTLSLQPNPEETIKFAVYNNMKGKEITRIPTGYYGNGIISAAITTKANDLLQENAWVHAIQLVKESKDKLTEDYVRSMIDYLVLNGRPTYTMNNLHWMVSNVANIGLESVDFGWGKPVYYGLPRAYSIQSLISRVRSLRGEDMRVVSMLLPIQSMKKLQKELGKLIGEPFESFRVMQPREHTSKI